MTQKGFYAIIRGISMNSIEVATNNDNNRKFNIIEPWNIFLPHLSIYDEVYIVPGKHSGVIDETGLLVIEPRFLVAVSDVLNAISCPRMVYVSHMGARPLKDEFINTRQLEGILLHEAFTNRIIHQKPMKETINETIENKKLELILADVEENTARDYLMHDAIHFENFNIDGQSEIDLKHYGLGLYGKLDALSDKNMIIELKSSAIPESIPRANHNIQLNMYQDILEDYISERPKGKVLYVSNGAMGIKDPQPFPRSKSVVGRNWAYLVLSGKYIPPLLRGEDLRICRSCYKKEGCHSLCAGLEFQRDCKMCYFEHECDKRAWPNALQEFYIKETNALTVEQLEAKKEEFVGLRQFNSISAGIDSLKAQKIDEHTNHAGKFIAEFKYEASDTRYRRGDYLTIYPKSQSDLVELSFSGILRTIKEDKMVIETANILPDTIEIFPSTTSFLMTRSRETVYKAMKSKSPVTKLIIKLLSSQDKTKIIQKMGLLPDTKIELQKPFKNYNVMQLKAITAGMNTQDFAVIQGPAGTGKTSVIVELIHQIQARSQSVLVSAFTNQAVDNIAFLLAENGIDFLRFGSSHPKLTQYTVANNPEKFKEFINNPKGRIILSTTSTIGKDTYDDLFFDHVIIDEASQMTLANTLMPMIHGAKVILVGDHKQLPPIVLSEEAIALDLHKSLFEKLVEVESRFIMLNQQYRMSDEILELPNKLFYDNNLMSANSKISNQNLIFKTRLELTKSYQVIAIETSDELGRSQSNYEELVVIANLVNDMLEDGINPKDIGIIAPYRAQIAYLRKYIPEVQIDTIDRFQGSESDIIIFSTTTTMDVPILSDPRRINVALTRARKKLILLQTKPSSLRSDTLMRQIYRDAFRRGNLVEVDSNEFTKFRTTFDKLIKEHGLSELVKDVSKANYGEIGDFVIYYGSIPLMIVEMEEQQRCHICYADTRSGVQCHGCGYLYHFQHLLDWVKKEHKCPICKHKLELVG